MRGNTKRNEYEQVYDRAKQTNDEIVPLRIAHSERLSPVQVVKLEQAIAMHTQMRANT